MKRVTIDPITRLEGHGKIEIFVGDDGQVAAAYFQVPELRGFEKFCEGRPVEELPRITSRICGVCPEAHHLASTKALDQVFNVEPPPAALKLRELFYCAHQIHSHIAHFYALAAPDFVLGPDAEPSERNVLGLIGAVGLELGREVIRQRSNAQKIQQIIGGKATHPVCGLPGGMSKPLLPEERSEIEAMARSAVEFARTGLGLFDKLVLAQETYVDLIQGDVYRLDVGSMGLVDAEGYSNFYDGSVRTVDTAGAELCRFSGRDYLDHVSEHVLPWSYLKFPYLKERGWTGFTEGPNTSIYRVGPLGRFNVSRGYTTALAHETHERMVDTLGAKPWSSTLSQHWIRLVEILYAAERMLELSLDEEITSPEVRALPEGTPGEGVGIVEAPRGTLIHHYRADEAGLALEVNLIVATTHNNAPICMSIKRAAEQLIAGGRLDEGILNRVEMAFRAYDPCLACATHYLPGQMPLVVVLRDPNGNEVQRIAR